MIGWQSATASAAYISGTLIQGIVTLTIPTYEPQKWQAVLVIWAVIAWGLFINTIARGLLPWLEGPLLVIHVLGFFGVVVPIVVLGEHSGSSKVWASFNNGGEWPTQGVSTMVGLLMSLFLFTGVDGVVHVRGAYAHSHNNTDTVHRCRKRLPMPQSPYHGQ